MAWSGMAYSDAFIFDISSSTITHGPLARYVKLRVVHAQGMPGTFSPPPRVSDPDMHHGTCVTHVPWCMPGSLTSSFLWSRWREKRSLHSRRMRNPQFFVSGKKPMSSNSNKLMILIQRQIHSSFQIPVNATAVSVYFFAVLKLLGTGTCWCTFSPAWCFKSVVE